ncbi:sulfite exporter TauE/SafE family protein [Flavobacteriaceae bacterium Ap0902]|nr:sulfite exporter TauE/SafE family protein [Flavobacteriaceae bacterium Ap0902]
MEYALIIAALGLGLGTSLHCLGMCGPIAFSLGLGSEGKFHAVFKNLTYQLGRIVTYSFLGAILGILGQGVSFAGFQKYLSIAVGIIMILMVFMPKNLMHGSPNKFLGRLLIKLKSALANFIQRKSYGSLFVTGILNGFLPCGMVYIALAGALGIGHVTGSALFMTFFGLGTMPLMFMAVLFGSVVSIGVRNRILSFMPVLTVIIGLLFIIRGLELGIPYLSPAVESLNVEAQSCCH